MLPKKQLNKLLEAFLALPSLETPHGRDDVIRDLCPEIRDRINRKGSKRNDVKQIVETCKNYPEGLNELLDILKDCEGNSIPFQNVKRIWEEIQQQQENAVKEIQRKSEESPQSVLEKKGDKRKIFICYAREDEKKVEKLYQDLADAGFRPWMDKKDILPGENWKFVIKKSIQESSFFLACLTINALNKQGIFQQEIRSALKIWRQKFKDDIYLIPVRLENCPVPEALKKFHWVDLFDEDESNGIQKLITALRDKFRRLSPIITLRPKPSEKNTTVDDVTKMLIDLDFYDHSFNWKGHGIQHLYELQKINNDLIVFDHSTNLAWQQGGSGDVLNNEAQDYIEELNRTRFAGFADWRLPTLEEAMSLMEVKQNEEYGFHIDSKFDYKQEWIWTVEKGKSKRPVYWGVSFKDGGCKCLPHYQKYCVRAVRSGR